LNPVSALASPIVVPIGMFVATTCAIKVVAADSGLTSTRSIRVLRTITPR
jgi:hypothetical protein